MSFVMPWYLEPFEEAMKSMDKTDGQSITDGESGISLCDTCSNCECIFQTGVVREKCDFYKKRTGIMYTTGDVDYEEDFGIDDIDFFREHPKADMSNVDRIIINKKVYLSADRVFEIIDGCAEETAKKVEEHKRLHMTLLAQQYDTELIGILKARQAVASMEYKTE